MRTFNLIFNNKTKRFELWYKNLSGQKELAEASEELKPLLSFAQINGYRVTSKTICKKCIYKNEDGNCWARKNKAVFGQLGCDFR